MKIKHFKLLVVVVVAALTLSIPVVVGALQQGTPTPRAYISADLFPIGSGATIGNCSFLNVRRGPGVGYSAFAYLARGDSITVLEYSQMWIRIDTARGQGWVYAGYVLNDSVHNAVAAGRVQAITTSASLGNPIPLGLISPEMFPIGSQVTVDFCYFLNVRMGPARAYSAFTTVARGDVLTILDYSQKWVLVDTPRGQGWVYCGYLNNDAALSAITLGWTSTTATYTGTSVGWPTPVGDIYPEMFPIGSQQIVDYCYFLNVRRGPARAYGAFTYLARGDVVTVLEYSQKWIRVDTPRGQGWIYCGYLRR